jgi:hypothetical protein
MDALHALRKEEKERYNSRGSVVLSRHSDDFHLVDIVDMIDFITISKRDIMVEA